MLIVLIAISSNPSVAVTEGGQVWSLIFCLVNVGKNNGFVNRTNAFTVKYTTPFCSST